MRPPQSAIAGLIAIVIVLIIALTYLVSVDKAAAPQVAIFGTSITTIIGALVILIARDRADAYQLSQAPPPPTVQVQAAQPLTKQDVADMVQQAIAEQSKRAAA